MLEIVSAEKYRCFSKKSLFGKANKDENMMKEFISRLN